MNIEFVVELPSTESNWNLTSSTDWMQLLDKSVLGVPDYAVSMDGFSGDYEHFDWKEAGPFHSSNLQSFTTNSIDNSQDWYAGNYPINSPSPSHAFHEIPAPVLKVVYGWHLDPSVSGSSACLTYLEDAVGKQPASITTSGFDYGDWQNAFFMPRPCMLKSDCTVDYYLDPNDYTKKLDGTTSDVGNASYDGNAMMEWGKLYFKYLPGEADGEGSFYVSNFALDSDYHCWCNLDCDGNEIPHFYTGIYGVSGTDKMRSISGVATNATTGYRGLNFDQQLAAARANNTTSKIEWDVESFAERLLINGLMVLISKNLDCQTAFGGGITQSTYNYADSYVGGTLNTVGLFGVELTSNPTSRVNPVKTFGMENWYGLCTHRVTGLVRLTSNKVAVKLTQSTADGSTVSDYNATGEGYIEANHSLPAYGSDWGYITKMQYEILGYYYPIETTGSNTVDNDHYCDFMYNSGSSDTRVRVAVFGGNYMQGYANGIFFFDLSNSPLETSPTATLICKPHKV